MKITLELDGTGFFLLFICLSYEDDEILPFASEGDSVIFGIRICYGICLCKLSTNRCFTHLKHTVPDPLTYSTTHNQC